MSDMFWENDGSNGEQPRESNAMRALREKAEADSKAIAELRDMVGTLTQELSAGKVEKVVTSKGFDPGLAEIAKTVVGSDPQAVETWLKDNEKLFAKAAAAPSAEDQEPTGDTGEEQSGEGSVVPADEQAALAAHAAAAQGSTPAKGLEAVVSSMSQAQSADDVEKLLQTLRPTQG